MKTLRTALLVVLLAAPAALAEDGSPNPPNSIEAFGPALKAMGIAEKDLGYRPKAHWPRYPHPKTVPYVMPFFEDLLAAPLDTYAFTRFLGNAVEDLLTPELLRAVPKDKKRGKETLYKLGVMLATERRIGGFRVFGMDTAGFKEPVGSTDTLRAALDALIGPPPRFRRWQAPAASRGDVTKVPEPLRRPLATLLNQLRDAHTWIERGLRRVSEGERGAVFKTLPELAASTPDGTKYFPIIDDVAKRIDEHSLHFGCLKALQAVQNARRRIRLVPVPEGGWPRFELRVNTRFGTVLFDNSPDGRKACSNPFVVVSFPEGNTMSGPLGATSYDRSLSVALLMNTKGVVGTNGTGERVHRGQLASGILGCGIVYAAGEGNHEYRTDHWGMGGGLFGLGALIDEGGDDTYRMASVGQGAAFFGAGLLLDAAGDDQYVLREGDGQGFGGPSGVGILADRSGNDRYYAEPDAKKAGRADYHSKDKIAVSNAMGCGSGRRGDISDGHVWAGGLGALIDVEGDDRYEAGNFSMGLGYWYGTGLMWDGGGDDVYRSVYFTQGSGAHFAIGALIDEGGNDRHELWDTAGAALAFGWDVVNAFLIDRGKGNDYYEADRISVGVAEVRSNAFFIDEGGDDTYVVTPRGKFLGDVDDRASYKEPGRTSDFTWRMGQVGVFLDLGGVDKYLERKDRTSAPVEAKRGGDHKTWGLRTHGPKSRGAPNVAIGRDVNNGHIGWLEAFPRRK